MFASDWENYKTKNYFDKMKNFNYKVNLTYSGDDGNMLKTSVLRHYAQIDL